MVSTIKIREDGGQRRSNVGHSQWCGKWRSAATKFAVVGVLLGAPVSAWAVEPERAAATLARQAAQVDDAGDHKRAAELYAEAFQTDPTQPNYLYAAARAEMSAGQRALARAHFEQFLQLADSGTDRADKARAYLADLRSGEVDGPMQEADHAAQAGRWKDAARLYYAVWDTANTRWTALFKAGVAAQEAEELERAEEWLAMYVQDAPKDVADRPEAESRLKRLRRDLRLAGGPGRAMEVPVTAREGGHSGRWVAGWVLVGTGLGLMVGGGALFGYAMGEETTLQRDLKLQDGLVTGNLTHAQAQERADAIGGRQTAGAALAGTGVAALGVGVVLILLEPEPTKRTTSTPWRVGPLVAAGTAGVQLGWRF